jgi:hypothetical protein
LWSDPGERHDLGGELPNKLAELLGTLKEWRTEMTGITGEPDPIQSHGLSLPYSRFMERMFARR